MTGTWDGSSDPVDDIRRFRDDPDRHRGLGYYEPGGWTIQVPPGEDSVGYAEWFLAELRRVLTRATVGEPEVRAPGPIDSDLFRRQLREGLERIDPLWRARGWIVMRPAREVPPPIGRRITPAEARQIREDVAEEFRGWSGL